MEDKGTINNVNVMRWEEGTIIIDVNIVYKESMNIHVEQYRESVIPSTVGRVI